MNLVSSGSGVDLGILKKPAWGFRHINTKVEYLKMEIPTSGT